MLGQRAAGGGMSSWLPALVVLAAARSAAIAAPEPGPAAEPPAATWLDKVTWSRGGSVTRVQFHAGRRIEPKVDRPSPNVLRIDLHGVGVGLTPASLPLGSAEVRGVTRVPASLIDMLPAEVSVRFLVELARADLGWAVVSDDEGFTLHVGALEEVAHLRDEDVQIEDIAHERVSDEPPVPSETLDTATPFRASGDLVVRVAPSLLAAPFAAVREGQTCIADARRGDWVHLGSGGWLRHDLRSGSRPSPTAAGPRPATRTAMAWSAQTLSGLTAEVVELPRGVDAAVDAFVALLGVPVTTVALLVRVDPATGYGFKLPPKEGRLVLELDAGRRVKSLDPRAVAVTDPARRSAVDATHAVPEVHPGDAWSTVLLLPADIDLARVKDAWLDVGGKPQRLLRSPGSGEPVATADSGRKQ